VICDVCCVLNLAVADHLIGAVMPVLKLQIVQYITDLFLLSGIEYDDNYINVRSPSTPFISANTSARNTATANSDLSLSAQSGVSLSLRGTYGDSSGQFVTSSSE
jgi:hypothetical protein